MSTFKIAEAKARFSELVEKAMRGEEVVIARASRPVLRLVRIEPPPSRRRPGSARGLVKLADDFDEIPAFIGSGERPPDRGIEIDPRLVEWIRTV